MTAIRAALAAGVIRVDERGWTQSSFQPGDGLELVYKVATDAPYEINISNTEFENFEKYWYSWITPSGFNQNDTLYTQILGTFAMGEGNDTITVDINPDGFDLTSIPSYLLGGSGDDVIGAGSDNANAMHAYGGSDDDSIDGGFADDLLHGDEVNGYAPNPTTTGFTALAYDTVTDGDDTIDGHEGDDTIIGGGGDDVLTGGTGDDSLTASSGRNQFFGNEGADTITGGSGSDFIYGGPRGSGQNDILSGGGGADVFMLSYTDTSNPGADFWAQFFDGTATTVTGDSVENGLADIFKEGLEGASAGFISAALGGIGQAVVDAFLSWIGSLVPSPTPQADLIVVRDFDPSQDVIVLPAGVDLSESAPQSFNPDDAGDSRRGIAFVDGTSKVYAQLTLGDPFLASIGLTQDDTDQIDSILNILTARSTTMNANGSWTGLSNVSAELPDGGFSSVPGAQLPEGSKVLLFGAIGGLVHASEGADYSNDFIVGTQYADALTINPKFLALDAYDNDADDRTATSAVIHGLGGDDLIYGGDGDDILRGGDGDDTVYSFKTASEGEDVSGGAGDDMLFGGGSAGTFDGGDGRDTFGVQYGAIAPDMQLFVDLPGGKAGERAPPLLQPLAAPVGPNPPFVPAALNSYMLLNIENVIGGTLNDWIRMTAGGTVEGGAGADYIDITAGGATLSYAGSTAPVSVQLFRTGAKTSGGDAEGDVLNYGSGSVAALVGTAGDDTLGGFTTGQFTVTGGGGDDVFQVTDVIASDATLGFTITDFNNAYAPVNADNDIIDLRLIGATRQEVVLLADRLLIENPGGVAVRIDMDLVGYRGFLTEDMVLFADSVSGTGRAEAGGSGLAGGIEANLLIGQAGRDFLFGKGGNDTAGGYGGDDILDGGDGDDLLRGDGGDDRLSGGDGADSLFGGEGRDLVRGGTGHDSAWGGAGDDSLQGEAGDDWLVGGDGHDSIIGGAGRDSLWGGAGHDRLHAGAGNDRVLGNDGNDIILGEAGNDRLLGQAGDDWLIGGPGNDTLDGGAGRDTLSGGQGADVLRGGADADIFRLTFGETQGDAILDFNAAEGDRLVLSAGSPIAVTDLGDGSFTFTDGLAVETLRVVGASVSDFDLLLL
jgi:Ca2+-binding RTX toxin-like protein